MKISRHTMCVGLTAFVGALVLGAASISTSSAATTLKLAETLPAGYPSTEALTEMGDKLSAKSGGELKMQVYPGGQLGNEKEMIEQTQLGAIQFSRVNALVVASIVDELNVLALPYLFKDVSHLERLIDSPLGDDLLDRVAKHPSSRLVGLAWMGAGARSVLTTKKKIEKPDDLQGQKIRVIANPILADTIEAMGASGVPLGFGDVFAGMQTGMLDGAEGSGPTLVSASLHTVAKHYSLTQHVIVPDILVMSKRAWDKLSKEEQQLVKQSAKEAEKRQRELWKIAEGNSADTMRAAGVEITEFQGKDKLREMTAPLREKYGAKHKELVLQIEAL